MNGAPGAVGLRGPPGPVLYTEVIDCTQTTIANVGGWGCRNLGCRIYAMCRTLLPDELIQIITNVQ